MQRFLSLNPWAAEVINTAFFGTEIDALDYSLEEDGSVRLSDQPYLQVSIASTHQSIQMYVVLASNSVTQAGCGITCVHTMACHD